MKYVVTGFTQEDDGPKYPLSITDVDGLAAIPELVARLLWVEGCLSVSVEMLRES